MAGTPEKCMTSLSSHPSRVQGSHGITHSQTQQVVINVTIRGRGRLCKLTVGRDKPLDQLNKQATISSTSNGIGKRRQKQSEQYEQNSARRETPCNGEHLAWKSVHPSHSTVTSFANLKSKFIPHHTPNATTSTDSPHEDTAWLGLVIISRSTHDVSAYIGTRTRHMWRKAVDA